MGDRGNIVIHGVWLYTHWGGSEIKQDLQKALQRHLRWGDPTYLARIIFDQMKGNDFGEMGFGISTQACDNEYPILIVDCDKQEVREVELNWEDEKWSVGKEINKWTFEEYVRAKFEEQEE